MYFFACRPDTQESFDVDVSALKKAVPGNEDAIEAITVGSEALYRDTFTGPELLKRIQKVEKMFPKVRVGTADSWNKFADGTADALIEGGVKYLYAYLCWKLLYRDKLTFVPASSMPLLSGRDRTSKMLPQPTSMI